MFIYDPAVAEFKALSNKVDAAAAAAVCCMLVDDFHI